MLLLLVGMNFFCFIPGLYSETKIPNIPVYEKTDRVIYKIERSEFPAFKKLYKGIFQDSYQKVYSSSQEVVVSILKKDIKKLERSNINFERLTGGIPFRYFDPGYLARVRRGYQNLEDLKTGYKDYKLNSIYLKGIAKEFPDYVTLYEIGYSRRHFPVYAVRISSPVTSNKVSVLFTGAHHSNELMSTEHCYDIIYHLVKDFSNYKKYLDKTDVWVVPMVNPDGSYFFWHRSYSMGRKNGYLAEGQNENDPNRGVDLNRNYPFKWNSGHPKASSGDRNSVFYRGTEAASEPETKAMISLAEENRFLFAMSFHSFATALLFPYTINNTWNPEPDYAKFLGEKLLEKVVSYRSDKKFSLRKNLYPVDGTDQDYYYHQFGTNAYIFETSHQNIEYVLAEKILKGVRPAWKALLKEFVKGEKLLLHITDEAGNPLPAEVQIEGLSYFEGESHTSNPADGIFVKMLTVPGEYRIKLTLKGYSDKEVILQSGKNTDPIKVTMQKKESAGE